MAYLGPVLQRDDLIDLAEALTEICSALSDGKSICIRTYLDIVDISLNVTRESAAVATLISWIYLST